MNTMSVTRALTELKRIDAQFKTNLESGKYLYPLVGKGVKAKVSGENLSIKEAENNINSSFDKIEGLIEKRSKLKSAIILSNLKTTVKLGDIFMTVAEAIDLKQSVEYKKQFVATLKKCVDRHNKWYNDAEREVNTRIDNLLSAAYGGDKGRVDAESTKSISDPQLEQHAPSILDKRNISSVIEKLQKEIDLIETELDFVLSESNSVTMISV